MKLNSEQKGVARGAGLAAVFSAVFLVVGYIWFPFELGSFEGPAAPVGPYPTRDQPVENTGGLR